MSFFLLNINTFKSSTGFGLDDLGSIPGKGRDHSVRHRVRTGSEAHPVSYPIGSNDCYAKDKAARVWSWSLTSVLMPREECVFTLSGT
jgi:hypothetical protein